jgi:hypothetical protein
VKYNRQLFIAAGLVVAAAFTGCGTNPVWKQQAFAFTAPGDPTASVTRTNLVALTKVTISPMFRNQCFTYRTGEETYEQDPYACFLVPPERSLTEAIRGWMRERGAFGDVIEPGSGLAPSVIVEAAVNELDGDFRKPGQPLAVMSIRFTVYDVNEDGPGRVLLDKTCAVETPLAQRTPAALIAAWDGDLRKIMEQINSEYAKTDLNDRR